MAAMSYMDLLSNWFRHHLRIWQKSQAKPIARTGYAAAYPPIKPSHRRSNRHRSSIRGCASFARYERYKEGDSEDDC